MGPEGPLGARRGVCRWGPPSLQALGQPRRSLPLPEPDPPPLPHPHGRGCPGRGPGVALSPQTDNGGLARLLAGRDEPTLTATTFQPGFKSPPASYPVEPEDLSRRQIPLPPSSANASNGFPRQQAPWETFTAWAFLASSMCPPTDNSLAYLCIHLSHQHLPPRAAHLAPTSEGPPRPYDRAAKGLLLILSPVYPPGVFLHPHRPLHACISVLRAGEPHCCCPPPVYQLTCLPDGVPSPTLDSIALTPATCWDGPTASH